MPSRYVVEVQIKRHWRGQVCEDAMVPQVVEAEDLRQALHKAAELPLSRWYPPDDEAVVRDYPS